MTMQHQSHHQKNAPKHAHDDKRFMKLALSAIMVVLFVSIAVFLAISRIYGSDGRPLLEIVNVTSDKNLYHSSEVMTLKVSVYAGKDLQDVNVTANGVVNRLNATRIVNLTRGVSEVPFVYTLPKCNVCGGISAGYYNITGGVVYGNTTLANYTQIVILQ
jgi:hypothetical protein